MLRHFTWTEKYEEAMSDEHPLQCIAFVRLFKNITKAYFRRRTETTRAENISAQLGSA